jgi:sarcosine oxidase delta subunit
VSQPAGQHEEWLTSVPPGVILRRLGGAAEARRLAAQAATRLQLDSDVQLFQRAFDQGNRERRWESVNGMAAFLDVDRNWLGRLMRGDENVASMKIGDLYRCASLLRIVLGIEAASPEHIERQVLHTVVQGMREQRRNGCPRAWPDLGGEDEAETIRRWARKVGYIDDPPSREAGSWREWLSHKPERIRTAEPALGSSSCLLKLVGLGDWLAARPYLPLFESQLYSDLRVLHKTADDRHDSQLRKAILDFLRPLAEAQEMLGLFRSTRNGAVEEVARKRNWRPTTVEVRLDRLGLTAEDFRGEEAVLGRLIIRSPVLRPLFDGLLSHREWSAGSADALRERRGQ